VTQVNLLPADVKNRQRVRRITMAAVGGVCAVIVVLLAVFVLQSSRLGEVNQQLGAEQLLNSGLKGKIAQLTKFEDLRKSVTARQALVDGLLSQQILWSDTLTDLSSAMPSGVWITSMNGSLSAGGQGGLVGSIALDGTALGFKDVASFLARLEQVKGWENAWVSSASRLEVEGQDAVSFSATIDLSTVATVSGRAK
jgi:Tfp pilus assembly protein PilN